MRILLGIIAVLVAAVVGGAYVVHTWILTPEFVEERVFAPLEARTGIAVDLESLGLAFDGIDLRGVSVYGPRNEGETDAAGTSTEEPPPLLRIEEVTVRPAFGGLLSGRIEIPWVQITGLDISVHRDASGKTNVGRLVEALDAGQEAVESPEPQSDGVSIDVARLAIETSTMRYTDDFERPGKPLRVRTEIQEMWLRDLRNPTGIPFQLRATIEVGDDDASDLKATGTISPEPLVIDTDLELTRVDVDTLVHNLRKPHPDGIEPGPLPLEEITVRARLAVPEVRYEGFDFHEVRGHATLDGTALSVPELQARFGGGDVKVSADIDFGVQGFRYAGTAHWNEVDLDQAGGYLRDLPWGRTPPVASGTSHLEMAGTEKERLLDTLDLEAHFEIDALDPVALLTRDDGNREIGPYDTGKGRVALDLRVKSVPLGLVTFEDVHLNGSLEDSRLEVQGLSAAIADGRFDANAKADLSIPGLSYSGAVTLADTRIEVLTQRLDPKSWGERSGRFGFHVDFHGHGSEYPEMVKNLVADGRISWTDGGVSNSEYLREISKVTGIPGFRELEVMNSGGAFQMRNGVLSTERIRVWGPDAGLQVAGTVDYRGDVDAQVALAIGPDSNRELFSTGVVLPYVRAKNGWRFVPVDVSHTVADPVLTIPAKAVLESALTTIPGAGITAVRRGAEATLQVSDSVLGRENPVSDGGRAVVDGSLDAVGSAFRGIGRLFGVDGDEDED